MQITWQLIAGLGAVVVTIVVVSFFLRAKTQKTAIAPRQMSRGPANLRFSCAGCSAQFNHTKRTIAAWEKGTRRFFCNACHTKWRDSRPSQPAQQNKDAPSDTQASTAGRAATSTRAGSAPSRHFSSQPKGAGSGSGCLGAMALLIAVPVALVFVVAHYGNPAFLATPCGAPEFPRQATEPTHRNPRCRSKASKSRSLCSSRYTSHYVQYVGTTRAVA